MKNHLSNLKVVRNLKPRQLGLAVTTFAALGFTMSVPAAAGEFRTINGLNNNPNDPTLGEAETPLLRLLTPEYEDGFNAPRITGPTGNVLPNARDISNTIVRQTEFVPNFLNASDWIWQWGQFIDHDLDLNEGEAAPPPEDFTPIPINPIDISTGLPDPLAPSIPFVRVPTAPGTGTGPGNPRQQINQLTSFIDGSQVYGSDSVRAEFLRTNDGTGKLKSQIINGEELLPFNTGGLPNANTDRSGALAPEELFIGGDVRVNEQIGLTAVHTLFVREHNRIAETLAQQIDAGDPVILEKLEESGLDKGDFIYESTRKVVGAQIQVITYNEFLPLFIGDSLLEDYSGYDSTVDPRVSVEFANGTFRVGHTFLSPELQRINNDGTSPGGVSLSDAFFTPQEVIDNGVDSLFFGLASQVAQEFDNQIVDEVRNFLASIPTGGFDLASLNIARGREVGLPGYNQARVELGLAPVTGFLTTNTELGITSDPEIAALFEQIYQSVDDVDWWIGGISEDSFNGGLVGELFNTVISDQFRRARDGDRFFFLNDLDHLLALAPDLESTRLSDIIRRNSSISKIQDNAFVVPEDVPEPSSILGLVTLLGLAAIAQRYNFPPKP
ncbi:MAG: PEP-CTERM sorting domain-containing protein [Moorea sp. SIO1F2]|uniref:peroxidase family protein n=1 Tax=Moorena sp. SIO1F2 TaxID=2607819 RepID=UPI0013BE0AD1|nr:peroxidase family protein [Moorena sp. SIO1F2]NET84885.1 PEP-CTERM sorting domain-containing protein [Moorena sp. SIO1F2]